MICVICTRNKSIKKQFVMFKIYGREDNYSSIRTNFTDNPCVSIIVFPGNSSSLSSALIKRNQKLPPSRVSDLSVYASVCLYLHILLFLGRGTPLIGYLLIFVLCFDFLYWLGFLEMLCIFPFCLLGDRKASSPLCLGFCWFFLIRRENWRGWH